MTRPKPYWRMEARVRWTAALSNKSGNDRGAWEEDGDAGRRGRTDDQSGTTQTVLEDEGAGEVDGETKRRE